MTSNFEAEVHHARALLLMASEEVERGEWQGLREGPQTRAIETYNVVLKGTIPQTMEEWQEETKPNLPWAEDHFQERVSGKALNPGEQYKNWPWYDQGVEGHKPAGKFSHTYMERFWPIDARYPEFPFGIRHSWGDLSTLVTLLKERPGTRQAYLPIWFPEDLTAALSGARVPCTLGYHFQVRPVNLMGRFLDVFYPMRSCDFFRYLRDDAYMAGRLVQWICQKTDYKFEPGTLTMHIANLHIFAPERERLSKEHYDVR